MKYQWDAAKRASNLAKHGVDFAEAEEFDWESALVIPDTRVDYGEARFLAMGPIGKRLYAMAFTAREGDVRIVSLRKANPREVALYEAKQEGD